MEKAIHWYPGHMKKAQIEVEEKLKLVDCVIELLDARIPFSSRNEKLFELSKNKARLIVLTKSDLADPSITKEWISYYLSLGYKVISANLNNPKDVKTIIFEASKLGDKKHEKEIMRGLKPSPVRAMIIGIPNVGKSTLINKMANRKAASVQNKPGHTKSQQWIKVNKDFELLDTPGILQSNYEDKEKAINLALVGSIAQDILPIDFLANRLLSFLNETYPSYLVSRYGECDYSDETKSFNHIAQKRGYLVKDGYDINKAQITLLNEFKNGVLGRCSLEKR